MGPDEPYPKPPLARPNNAAELKVSDEPDGPGRARLAFESRLLNSSPDQRIMSRSRPSTE